ncbi:unnamed protein product [Chrysoparadoxa australica]
MEAFAEKCPVGELGHWISAVLHHQCPLKGDSPKIAGMLNLLATQGRWPASARLAYQRAVATSKESARGIAIDGSERPIIAPSPALCKRWGNFFEEAFMRVKDDIITVLECGSTYTINTEAVQALVKSLTKSLLEDQDLRVSTGIGLEFIPQSNALEAGFLQRHRHTEATAAPTPESMSGSEWYRWTGSQIQGFVAHTVKGFLRNDLYTAVTELMTRGEGSFGITALNTLEPGVVVIGCQGQPMAVGLDEDAPILLFGSEGEATAVPVFDEALLHQWEEEDEYEDELSKTIRGMPFDPVTCLSHRLDLDERGEVMRLGLPPTLVDAGSYATPVSSNCMTGAVSISAPKVPRDLGWLHDSGIHVSSYSLQTRSEASKDEMSNRLISQGMDQVVRPPRRRGEDLVAWDLRCTPFVMSRIDQEWMLDSLDGSRRSGTQLGLSTPTLKTAERFMQMLQSALLGRHDKDAIDLLIAGVEVSLWIGEQWLGDIRSLFPTLRAEVVSSNKILGIGAGINERVIFTGAQPINGRALTKSTVVLLISQSGQTFSTLHASRLLASYLGDRVFLLTGKEDTKMRLAVQQTLEHQGIPFNRNCVFSNFAGHCPAEPTSMAAAATHHTLTKLCLFAALWMDVHTDGGDKRLGKDIEDMVALVSSTAVADAEDICGASSLGVANNSSTHRELQDQGKRWALHVKEIWQVLVMTGAYIFLSVVLQIPLFHLLALILSSILNLIGWGGTCEGVCWSGFMWSKSTWDVPWRGALGVVLRLLDALLYIWCGYMVTLLLRMYQGRPLWARLGKRTMVIVDTPMVHQLSESFLSKLFSLSYSFTGLDVHGASSIDHFVHRFTHRVARGLLLAVGRPDGRIGALSKTEGTVLLAAKQASFIENWEEGPEILSVGHNPYSPGDIFLHSIVLKSNRRRFLDEEVYLSIAKNASSSVEGFSPSLREAYEACKAMHEHESLASLGQPDQEGANRGHKFATRMHGASTRALSHKHSAIPYGIHHVEELYEETGESSDKDVGVESSASGGETGSGSPSPVVKEVRGGSLRTVAEERPEALEKAAEGAGKKEEQQPKRKEIPLARRPSARRSWSDKLFVRCCPAASASDAR